MIVGIEGDIIYKGATTLWIKCHGIVYEVFVSLQTMLHICEESIFLFISQIIREDNITLYGFREKKEKDFFERIIKINGIGPKVALAILSTYTPDEFLAMVHSKDVLSLQKVPGLGPKIVNRIIVELDGDKLNLDSEASHKIQAFMALESLGFKTEKIQDILTQIDSKNTEEIIRQALKKL